jgi:CheY-like chemotaxis protein
MRALIVDGSSAVRAQVRAALDDAMTRLGLAGSVAEARSSVEALCVLAGADIDVLIVDYDMPGATGPEVLACWQSSKLRGVGQRALVVATGLSTPDRDRALARGAFRVLEKPLTGDMLAEALAGVTT